MDSVAFWFCDPQSQEKFCFLVSCRISLEIQSVLYCKVWWNWAAQRDPRYCWCCTWVWSVCWAEILSCSVHLAPPIHPGSWRQMLILISCCTSVSRCSSVGSVVYQGGCIFPFPNNISGLKVHFHGLEPCVVPAAASGLLEFPRTSWQWVQLQSEDIFYSLPFHLLSWGRPWWKLQENLTVWSFNESLSTVVCQRTGLDSNHACGEHSTNLCTGVQGWGDLVFWMAAELKI